MVQAPNTLVGSVEAGGGRGSHRKSAVVMLGITAVMATSLSGCGSAPGYQGICLERVTEIRVDDELCDDDSPGYVAGTYVWYYVRDGVYAPGVGTHATGGVYVVPGGSDVVRGGVVKTGGTVVRGGFGGSGGSSGG